MYIYIIPTNNLVFPFNYYTFGFYYIRVEVFYFVPDINHCDKRTFDNYIIYQKIGFKIFRYFIYIGFVTNCMHSIFVMNV